MAALDFSAQATPLDFSAHATPTSAPVTGKGLAKAAGSGAAGTVLQGAGGGVGDIRDSGRNLVDTVLGALVKTGTINPDQAKTAHDAAAAAYRFVAPGENISRSTDTIAGLIQAATSSGAQAQAGLSMAKQTMNPVSAAISGHYSRLPDTADMQAVTHTGYTPQNTPERYAKAVGAAAPLAPFAPAAAAGETLAAKIAGAAAQTAVPAITSTAAADAAKAVGGDENAQQLAGIVGGMAGGFSTAPRAPVSITSNPAEITSVAGKFAARARQDPAALTAKAEQFRTAGISPTLTDVVDENGRGVIQAAASRPTPARQVAQDFADSRATNLPDRIAKQAQAVAPATPPPPPNVDADAEALGGRIGVTDADPGAAVHTDLGAAYAQGKAGVDQAYSAARAAGADQAHVPMSERPIIAANLRDAVSDFDPAGVPRVTSELNRLDGLSTVTARDLFEARTRLSQLRISADPVEAKAAGQAVRALDGEINRVEPSMTGEPGVVGAWRNAIAQRRQFGQQFESGDLIHNLTEPVNRGGGMTTAVAPEDATTAIFGRSPLGWIGKPNLTRDLSRLRDTLGADSPTWKGLAGEAYNRLVQGSQTGGALDGAKLTANIGKLGQMADLFFSPEQKQAITNLATSASQPDAAAIGARVLQPGTDAFNADIATLSPAQRLAAQASGARAISAKAGESVAGAPGLARRIALAPEPGARLKALFGDQAAGQLQSNIGLEEQAVGNARQVAPRTSSPTSIRGIDQEHLATGGEVASTIAHAATGNPIGAGMGALKLYLKSFGLSDADAEKLVTIATDPAQTDAAISALSARLGRKGALTFVNQALATRGRSAAVGAVIGGQSRELVPAPPGK